MHQTHPSTCSPRRRRVLSLLLALALILGLFPGLGGTGSAHWADQYLDQLVEWGYVRPDQIQKPDSELTRADFMAITNRAYGYTDQAPTPFEDIKETDWFYDDVEIAYTNKYIKGTSETTASPGDTLTRETAATILGRNMMMQETPGEILDFTDARDISFWSKGVIKSSLERYLLSGYDDGTFRPLKSVSWGEMAAMVTRIVGTPLQEAGDYSLGGVFGNVTISSSGVTLRDTVISGDLYVTGGVGLGDIKLENVTVLGRIICSGTGEAEAGNASILLRNVTADELLIDNLQGKTVSVQADGITEIGKTTVRTSAYVEDNTPEGLGLHSISLEGRNTEDEDAEPPELTVAGRIENIVNKTPESLVHVAKGTVGVLTVDEAATDSQVTIDRNAEVKELNLDTATKVDGEGDIKHLNVNAPGCEVTILPEEIYIRPGLIADINGEEMDNAAAEESNREPQILSGYPAVEDVAPTSITAVFATNKKGTVYWAISPITDGSVTAEDLIKPPVYGGISVARGSVSVPKADEEVRTAIKGLKPGGSYYLSAVMTDERGVQSTVKVVSFTTPDNTVPAFCKGYPYMSSTSARDGCQVVVMPNKSCNLYYALLPEDAATPTEDEFKTNSIKGVLGYGVVPVTKNTESIIRVDDVTLEEQKTYVLYLWLVDADGANKSKITPLKFTTKDETPPYFIVPPTSNQVRATSVSLNFRLSEAGTVYWAVVPSGTEYPKKQPGHDTVNLSDMWAKLQVQNGYSAFKNGSSPAVVDRDGTINVTGLNPESSYDLYYVAIDKAGNYSVMVQKVTINSLDESGPKVRQYFSKYDGTDETVNPMPSTDIILEFSENIRYTGTNGGEGFLELYQAYDAAQGATAKSDALARLVTSVRGSITLWREDTGTGQNIECAPRYSVLPGEENHVENRNWVIDYEQVKVEMREGKLLVTFPEAGLKLDSGATYYFTIHDLSDTSSAQNPIAPSTVDFNQASTALGHAVPKFTTVFADVFLSDPGVKNGDPYERRALTAANTKPKKSDSLPVVSTANVGILDRTHADSEADITPANVDMHFQITPRSTKTVEENIAYDILLWTDTTCTYDLYYRIIDSVGDVQSGDKFYTDPTYGSASRARAGASVAASNRLKSRAGYEAPDDNGWVYLGYSGDLNTTGDWVGKTINGNFNRLGSSEFPALRNLDENLRYEFAISLRTVKGSDVRATWTGKVNMKVQVAAGWSSRLYSLSQGLDWKTTWPDFQKLGVNGGAQSVGKDIAGNFYFDIFQLFTDTRLPMFANEAPSFSTTSDSVTMSLALDRAGTIYYAVGEAKVASSNNRPAITTTYIDLANNKTDEENVPLEKVPESGADEGGEKYINDSTKATVTAPLNQNIFNPQNWTDALVAAATGSIVNPGGALSTPRVTDLKPKTTYYAYFVLKGTAQEISKVYIYQFTTKDISKPKYLDIAPESDGSVRVENDVKSVLDYRVFNSGDVRDHKLINILNEPLAGNVNEETTKGGGLPSEYANFTVLDAVLREYRMASTSSGYRPSSENDYYSVFDIYASPQLKNRLYNLILLGRNSNEYTTSVDDKGNTIEVNEIDDGHRISTDGEGKPKTLKLKQVIEGGQYIIFSMAYNAALSNPNDSPVDQVYSFRASDRVAILDQGKPNIVSITRTQEALPDTTITGTQQTYSGGLLVEFDRFIHWSASGGGQHYPASGANHNGGNARDILEGALDPKHLFTSYSSTVPSKSFVFNFARAANGDTLSVPNFSMCNTSGQPMDSNLVIQFREERTATQVQFFADCTWNNKTQKVLLYSTSLSSGLDIRSDTPQSTLVPAGGNSYTVTLRPGHTEEILRAFPEPDNGSYIVKWNYTASPVVTFDPATSPTTDQRTLKITAAQVGTTSFTVTAGSVTKTVTVIVESPLVLTGDGVTLTRVTSDSWQATVTNGNSFGITVDTIGPDGGIPSGSAGVIHSVTQGANNMNVTLAGNRLAIRAINTSTAPATGKIEITLGPMKATVTLTIQPTPADRDGGQIFNNLQSIQTSKTPTTTKR